MRGEAPRCVLQPTPTQLHPGHLPQALWLPQQSWLAGHPHPYHPHLECLGKTAEPLGGALTCLLPLPMLLYTQASILEGTSSP